MATFSEQWERHQGTKMELFDAAIDHGCKVEVEGKGTYRVTGSTPRALATIAQASRHLGYDLRINAQGLVEDPYLVPQDVPLVDLV